MCGAPDGRANAGSVPACSCRMASSSPSTRGLAGQICVGWSFGSPLSQRHVILDSGCPKWYGWTVWVRGSANQRPGVDAEHDRVLNPNAGPDTCRGIAEECRAFREAVPGGKPAVTVFIPARPSAPHCCCRMKVQGNSNQKNPKQRGPVGLGRRTHCRLSGRTARLPAGGTHWALHWAAGKNRPMPHARPA